jgi:serine/threonine protein kinase
LLNVQELEVGSQNQQHARKLSHGSNYWNQDEIQELRALTPQDQSSQGDASSILEDTGYSLEFSDVAEDRPLEQSLDHDAAASPYSTQIPAPFRERNFLDRLIRSKRVLSAERGNADFIPIDQLELIMTQQNVYEELQHVGIKEDKHSITNLICQREDNSRQRIFAILCMLRLPGEIVRFIHLNIFDRDLPFTFLNDKAYHEINAGLTRFQQPLPFFGSEPWEPHLCDNFKDYQRKVSAPIFRLSWNTGEKVRHYSLDDQLVLPFMHVEDTSKEGELGATIRRLGGTSIVRKVKIHPAHYNAYPVKKSQESHLEGPGSHGFQIEKRDPEFAVKELDVDHGPDSLDRSKDDREALALKRFNDTHDPHLIRLLVTYTYQGRFHMVFPWADGNLKDLWETCSPRIRGHHHSPEPVRWISRQILGLARALRVIHYCPIDNTNIQGLSPEDRGKPHGRHGDLKPENILWFKEEARGHNSDFIGTLKIADFGFADFHSEHSRSNVRKSDVGGITDTYRAPEYDVKRKVSPQYDIWSFGCILLQFVVWYSRGWEGVDNFSKARSEDSRGTSIASDLFFGLGHSVSGGLTARAKLSVIQVSYVSPDAQNRTC